MSKQIKGLIIVGSLALLLGGCGGDSVRTADNNSNIKKALKINADNYVVVAQHFQQKQARHSNRKNVRGYKQPRTFPGTSRADQDTKDSFLLSSSEPFNGKFKQYTLKYNNSKTITQIDEQQDSVRISYFIDDAKQNETTMSIQKFQDLQGER